MIKKAQWRQKLGKFIDSNPVHFLVLLLIVSNLAILGLSTSSEIMDSHGYHIDFFNKTVLVIYSVEIFLRFVANGRDFFRSSWNIIDIVIVTIGFLTFGGYIQILRVFRVIWLLRLLVYVPSFRHLIDSIIRSIPGLASVILLLVLTVYVFGVIGTSEFSAIAPKTFGTLRLTMGTLFETILMPDLWPDVYHHLAENHPYAWVYVFPIVIMVNYLLLQLVIGVLLNSLQRQYEDDKISYHSSKIKTMVNSRDTTEHEKQLSVEGQIILSEFRIIREQLTKITKDYNQLKKEVKFHGHKETEPS